jgi:hypothetical protein
VLTEDATFTVDMHGVDRKKLLRDAATEIDVLSGHYGDGDDGAETAEARLARTLSEEFAEFPDYPDILEITVEDFAASGREPPLSFTRRAEDHVYLWMRLPLALRPMLDWAFSRLELAVELSSDDGGDPRLRPMAYAILPHRKFQSVFEGSARVEVSFDANFELEAGIPAVPLPIGVPASAGAEAAARIGAGLGVSTNYEWRLQRARIDHTETGHSRVFWRIDGTEFFAEDVPTPIVVIQVPRSARNLEVVAALQAYRHLSLLNAGLRQKVEGLPRRFKEFFTGGSPLRDERTWDLSHMLAGGNG